MAQETALGAALKSAVQTMSKKKQTDMMYACNQCRVVLGQGGNQVLVDTDGQRFESFEYIIFAVNVVGNHVHAYWPTTAAVRAI
jgi:hypothetical protein